MSNAEEQQRLSDALAVFGTAIVVATGLTLLTVSAEPAMKFHGLLFALGGALFIIFVLTYSKGAAKSDSGYVDGPIKVATIAAIFWGIAGFLVGDILAWQLAFPILNLDLPWSNFGRLRPLHTSAVIFAFGGNAF